MQHHGADVAEEGWGAQDGTDAVEIDPTSDEIEEFMDDVAPDSVVALVSALKAAIAALPPRDQVVLSHLLGSFDLVGRPARRAYPTLDAEACKNWDQTAAALNMTWQELAQERQRMDEWLGDIGRKLQHDMLLTSGAE